MPPQNVGSPRTAGGPASEMDAIEFASRFVEQMSSKDLQFPSLYHSLLGADESLPISGFLDHDYPPVYDRGLVPKELFSTVHTAPIPAELQELINQPDVGSCQMGLFPEIFRAWMTIDSDLYLWDFRDGSDLSFYDGLKEPIITMALVPVKPNVFRASIQYLLCVSTISNIVILGFITASGANSGANPVMELVSQPVFIVSTDGMRFSVIVGSEKGRIFLGAADGSLNEISYQSERGWISDRCWKTNLTRSLFSSILPKFFASSVPDSIAQTVIDNSRNIIFTRSAEGSIAAYDLGDGTGNTFRTVGYMSFDSIVTNVMKISKNTLEPNFVRKIISIGAIEYGELNLVAVTDTGCRIYFSCYSPPTNATRISTIRPHVFNLVHVRMPPGYCPTAATRKPPFGQSAFLTQGIYTYVTRVHPEQDAVWLITPLMYPSQYCAEVCSVHMLPGIALDVRAIPMRDKSTKIPLPDVITQHLSWSRQIVILTPNGTVVYRALKPYELLRDLLLERKGPENLKGHFELCSNREQPLANSVLLACHPFNHLDQGIYDLATKAFFMYGSAVEQRHNITPHANTSFSSPHTSGMYDTTMEFNPNLVSTPNRYTSFQDSFGPQSPGNPFNPLGGNPGTGTPGFQQQQQQQQGAQQAMQQAYQQESASPYAPRHDALYLVVSRILLPFWHQQLIRVEHADGPTSPKIIIPNISGEEVEYAMTFLSSVLTFINNNPSLYISRVNVTPTSMATPDARRALNQEQEKNSIGALKCFLSVTLEVLGMWKLLCEHQFHIVLHGVDDRLHNSTMKELVVNGYSTVAIIINALVSKYLGDNAAVDAISTRLREVCPTLFKNEDAIGSKVAEILAKVKLVSDPVDRESMLQEALHLCEEICGHGRINIRNFCRQFAELGFPQGAVRLCLTSAKAADPNELALITLKGNTPSTDAASLQAYQKRMEIYKIVFEILDTYVASSATKQSPLAKAVQSQQQVNDDDVIPREKAKEYADVMIRSILLSDDEPFHIALYNWLIDRKLFDRLLEIKHAYLDSFLQRAADSVVSGKWPTDVSSPNDTRVLDLLWRHHEMNHNYLAAAQILHKLAESTTTGLNLYQRMEYLSRAIICCKSCNSQGELLEQLEAKLEVAQIQKMILDWVTLKMQVQAGVDDVGTGTQVDAKTLQELASRLNGQLFNITNLYGDYAVPLKLHDIRLEIFASAGHGDKQLIESLWADIVEAELQASGRHSLEAQMEIIRRKLVTLGRKFKNAPTFFPVEYLVEHLETMKPAENVDPGWVFKTMLDVGIPFAELLFVYERLWRKLMSRQVGGSGSVDVQIANVIVMMVGLFVNDTIDFQLSFLQRAELVEKCKDLISSMIVEFSSRFESSATEIAQKLTQLKDKLDRIR